MPQDLTAEAQKPYDADTEAANASAISHQQSRNSLYHNQAGFEGKWRDMRAEREVRRAINRKIRDERLARGDFDDYKGTISIRPIHIDDATFVMDSWVKAYRRSSSTGPVEPSIYHIEQRARINRLMQRSKTLVACEKSDKNLIRGWMCFEPPKYQEAAPIIHFICIHPVVQLMGIGSALVAMARSTHTDPEAPMWTSHDTQVMRHLRAKWNLLYNPYLLELNHASIKPDVAFQEGGHIG